jgi:hypothetical protein
MMKLVFICRLTQRVFRSDGYKIVENWGVSLDSNGRKRLEMKLRLSTPCPFCGRMHAYSADELACPLTGVVDDSDG